jgi:HEAT repeat protein
VNTSALVLSSADRDRIREIDRIAAAPGAVERLVELLTTRSWAVRRAVVAALARLGDQAVGPLAKVLVDRRDDEDRLAGAVDALSASRGDADAAMLALIFAEVESAPVLCDAAQVLGRRRATGAIEALSSLTVHNDDNVAVSAIEALGRIGGSAGVDALIRVLRGKSFFRIFPAIDVVGRSGDPRGLEPLLALLEKPRYALEAARALGRTGEVAATLPLARLLRRSNDALTRVIASSLHAIHARALERFGSAATVEAALRAGEEDPLPIIQHLAQSVVGASAEEQIALCSVLAWTNDDAAVATLIELLDSTPSAASAALRALGSGSHSQLLAALRDSDSARRALLLPLVGTQSRSANEIAPCLTDPDPAVRVLACSALARIGDPSVVPALFEQLQGSDPVVAQAAGSAIQSLGSAETERLALECSRSENLRVRRAALRIVAYFGYPAGLSLLIDAVERGDDRLRDAAIHGLALSEDPRAMETLLRTAGATDPRARAPSMRALGHASRRPESIAMLRAGLSDPDAWVRYYACQSLGKIGDATCVPEILARIEDPAGQVRVAAIEALARLDAPEALAALLIAAEAPDPDVQRAALLGLGERQRPEALPALVRASRSADATTRLIAISAISSSTTDEAAKVLAAGAGDTELSVRDAAIGFLASRPEELATQALIGALADPSSREHALQALCTQVPGRVTTIRVALEQAGHELAALLVAGLARMKRPDAQAAIDDALSRGSLGARRAAAAALATVRTPRARIALERAAGNDPDEEVRRLARAGLDP